MATGTDVITKALRGFLQDSGQTNYSDPNELLDYLNKALEFISKELALYGRRIGQVAGTITITGVGSYYGALPTDLIAIATGDFGEHLVFNQSNSNALMAMAGWTDIASWENESGAADELGEPDTFYLVGTNFYVHPRIKTSPRVFRIKYYQLRSLAASGDPMPWNDLFNSVVENWIVKSCHLRSEIAGFFQFDEATMQQFRGQLMGILLNLQDPIQFRPAVNLGWS